MSKLNDTWTRAHDLALIYLGLAYGTDYTLSDEELATVTKALQQWRAAFDVEDVQEVMLEAMTVFLEEDAGDEVVRSMKSLKDLLTEEERCKALEDVVRIAEADGVLLSSEQGLISMLAEVWELKGAGRSLLEKSDVKVEERPAWSLMHDISLIYLVVAHASNNELTDEEIAAMQERLRDWEPQLSADDIRTVLREALAFYADEPDQEMLMHSIQAIRKGLSLVQRLAVLNDLVFIAETDGDLNEHEEQMIRTLARHWKLDVRLNGQAQPSVP